MRRAALAFCCGGCDPVCSCKWLRDETPAGRVRLHGPRCALRSETRAAEADTGRRRGGGGASASKERAARHRSLVGEVAAARGQVLQQVGLRACGAMRGGVSKGGHRRMAAGLEEGSAFGEWMMVSD
eukprot:4120060-Prymnesium_polylepis.1